MNNTIWAKTNGKNQLLELQHSEGSSLIRFFVDGKEICNYGAKSDILTRTTSKEVFQVAGTKYGVTMADKQNIDKVTQLARHAATIAQAADAAQYVDLIKATPGLSEALAKYGTFEKAHKAEDSVAAAVLFAYEEQLV